MPSRDRNVGAPGQDTPGVSLHPLSLDSPDREPGESFLGQGSVRPRDPGWGCCLPPWHPQMEATPQQHLPFALSIRSSLLLVTTVIRNFPLPSVCPFHDFPPRL